MFVWSKINRQRSKISREDRRRLEPRVRRFLNNYLAASDAQKPQYYELVAGASAGCHPSDSVSYLENLRVAEMTARTADAIVRRRLLAGKDNDGGIDRLITDAFATAAVAYRRAAGIYVNDSEMQMLGTAAVHLLTMATSHRMAQAKNSSPEPG